jgi:hypothetical protein
MTNEIALRVTDFEVPAGDFRKRAFFENGYGISVIRFHGSYGNQAGLFEIVAIKGTEEDWDFDYTVLNRDVLGWQTPADVVAYAQAIAQLPKVTEELENRGVQEIK